MFGKRHSIFTMKRKAKGAAEIKVKTEQLKEWFDCVLDDNAEGEFFDTLSDGLRLLDMLVKVAPETQVKHKRKAKGVTRRRVAGFLGRENIAKFVNAMVEQHGMNKALAFEAEDLISQRNLLTILNCLIYLTRVAYKVSKVEPPELVKMEIEIEEVKEELAIAKKAEVERNVKFVDEGLQVPKKEHTIQKKKSMKPRKSVMFADVPRLAEETVVIEEQMDPEDFGITEEQLRMLKDMFSIIDTDQTGLITRRSFVTAILKNKEVTEFFSEHKVIAADYTSIGNEDSEEVDLREFVTWFAAKISNTSMDDKRDEVDAKVDQSSAKGRTTYLPYVPRKGDSIDEALALCININSIDVKIQRILISSKSKARTAKRKSRGLYIIGNGNTKVFVRQVSGEVLVRDPNGNQWIGLSDYCESVILEDIKNIKIVD